VVAAEENDVDGGGGDRCRVAARRPCDRDFRVFGMKAKRYKVLCRALRVNMPDF
jgi:hypothetical protein